MGGKLYAACKFRLYRGFVNAIDIITYRVTYFVYPRT